MVNARRIKHLWKKIAGKVARSVARIRKNTVKVGPKTESVQKIQIL